MTRRLVLSWPRSSLSSLPWSSRHAGALKRAASAGKNRYRSTCTAPPRVLVMQFSVTVFCHGRALAGRCGYKEQVADAGRDRRSALAQEAGDLVVVVGGGGGHVISADF